MLTIEILEVIFNTSEVNMKNIQGQFFNLYISSDMLICVIVLDAKNSC